MTHTPSANLAALATAAEAAARAHADDSRLRIVAMPALAAQPHDVMAADGLLFGTNENLASMTGISKDFFDRCYYPVLEEKQGLPLAAYVRAGHDGTGTLRQLNSITTGLRWRWVAEPMLLHDAWTPEFLTQVEELAAGLPLGFKRVFFNDRLMPLLRVLFVHDLNVRGLSIPLKSVVTFTQVVPKCAIAGIWCCIGPWPHLLE